MKKGLTPHLVMLGLVCNLCSQSHAWAGGLQLAYEAALGHDATYQAARAELASAQQGVPLARAGLLPGVSLSISDAKVDGTQTIDHPVGNATSSPLDYRAPSQSLNIRAPIYNREAMQKLNLAQSQVNYAQAVLAIRKLELVDRLATAYLLRLQSAQSWQAAHAQVAAAQSQSDLARRRLQLGEGTKPELLDAEAALETGKVLEVEAQNQIDLAVMSLRHITGSDAVDLPDEKQALDVENPQWLHTKTLPDEPLAQLLDHAQSSNPAIAARRYAIEMAQLVVARNGSGHYPRLDFVASASYSRNESVSTLNQSTDQRTWGLQLNMPLYSGGAVSASVSQALADQEKAQAELAAELQAVERDLTKLFNVVTNGGAKLQARQKTVTANRLALEGAQKGFARGFNTQTDVIQAQAKLAQARQDLTQAIYEHLLARVRLSARAGKEPADVIVEMEYMLR